ncbi:cytochrome P450 [Mycobacterium sp. CVI_P3]|uniref:Cytochrome P450 n=1 Tax=Mycobacterium pinniadriaticum TaxID=2994102 RepID=A0ABT3SMV5_9MYCO|nr:cytochrome P450 [Mycobacterium pinniadriaticum]MCX2934285.1 cytochrome P450 [Mycobacterium pinniadriaticum]MCX2940677.1 cytochrome P450 [Mycobacterium pinniadriaticum]
MTATTSISATVPTLRFDHHSAYTSNHRDDVLAQVRPHPIFWTESHGGYWVVTSHSLVKRVLRDPALFSSHKTEEMTGGVTIPTVIGPRIIPAEIDPPHHMKLRKILAPQFNRAAIERVRPRLEEMISGIIDDAVAKGDFDVVHDIADRIPAGAIVEYLGFAEEERIPFIASVHAALNVMPYASDPDFVNSPKMLEGMTALGHAVDVIKSLIAQRRADPTDDVVSHLVSPEFELEDDEILWVTFTLIVGGAENPAAMIGNSLLYLSQDADLRARLVADHSLIPAACEELLRQTSSAVSLARTVTQDIELEGAQLRQGDRLLVWLPAANRDATVFERPDAVDIDRPSCPHVALGDGPHVCVGAAMFRVWFDIMMREILTKMPDFTVDLDRSQRFDDAATMWGWRSMPATINSAPA